MSRPRRPAAPPRSPRSGGRPAGQVPLDGLGVAGIRSRHMVAAVVAVAVAWVMFSFAGQVSEAASAGERADRLRAENAALAEDVRELQMEIEMVAGQAWVSQQARAYQLGGRDERAFRLAPGAPTLPPDAPGSTTVRLGAERARQLSPLEAWLDLLFGPAPGG